MKKFVIIPNQNQILILRKFQDFLCDFLFSHGISCVPVFPIMIQAENLNDKSKITNISLDLPCKNDFFKTKYQKNEILSFPAKTEINGIQKNGKIEIVKILKDSNLQDFDDFNKIDFSQISQIAKKIGPSKLCEIEIEQNENCSKWKILSEKWQKY